MLPWLLFSFPLTFFPNSFKYKWKGERLQLINTLSNVSGHKFKISTRISTLSPFHHILAQTSKQTLLNHERSGKLPESIVRLPSPCMPMHIQYNHNHPSSPQHHVPAQTSGKHLLLHQRPEQHSEVQRQRHLPKKINRSLLLYQKLGQHPESQRIPNQVRGHTHTQSEPQLLNWAANLCWIRSHLGHLNSRPQSWAEALYLTTGHPKQNRKEREIKK